MILIADSKCRPTSQRIDKWTFMDARLLLANVTSDFCGMVTRSGQVFSCNLMALC